MSGVVWGLLAALSWGTGDFLARFTGRAIGVSSTLFWALTIGAAVMSGAYYLSGDPFIAMLDPTYVVLIALSGFFLTIALFSLYLSIARGPIALAAPIISAHPMFVILLSIPLGVMPSAVQWVFIGVTIIGILALSRMDGGEDNQGGMDGETFDAQYVRKTVRIAFVSMAAFTLAMTLAQEATQILGTNLAALGQRVFAMVFIALFLLVRREAPKLPAALPLLLVLVAQGLFDLGGSFAILSGSEGVGRAVTVVVSACFAVVTVILAAIFLKEPIKVKQWACVAIILAGVVGLSWFE